MIRDLLTAVLSSLTSDSTHCFIFPEASFVPTKSTKGVSQLVVEHYSFYLFFVTCRMHHTPAKSHPLSPPFTFLTCHSLFPRPSPNQQKSQVKLFMVEMFPQWVARVWWRWTEATEMMMRSRLAGEGRTVTLRRPCGDQSGRRSFSRER